MSYTIQKSLVCMLGLGLVMLSTGCMTTPGNGEYTGESRHDPVEFSGFLLDGDEWVRIEAKHPVTSWQTIGWTKSSLSKYHWSGEDWHPWNATVHVPGGYWTPAGGDYMKAEVRAVRHSTNGKLNTFKKGFNSYWDYNESLGSLWSDHGHGNSVIIYSEGPIIK